VSFHWVLSQEQHHTSRHKTGKSPCQPQKWWPETLWFRFCKDHQLETKSSRFDGLCGYQMVQGAWASSEQCVRKTNRHLGNRLHHGRDNRRRSSVPWWVRDRPAFLHLEGMWQAPSSSTGEVQRQPTIRWLQVPRGLQARVSGEEVRR